MAVLQQALQQLLTDARLQVSELPGTDLRLWLLDAKPLQRRFEPDEVQRVMDQPPYWSFCWASGLVLARWLQQHPHWVHGRSVLDFGSGSGVAGIAAAQAGSARVVACDLDPLARLASQANAELNGVELSCVEQPAPGERFDVLLAADVLYDRSNLPLLDYFPQLADTVLLADSRLRDFKHPLYTRIACEEASTWPDLDESPAFRHVSLYQAGSVAV